MDATEPDDIWERIPHSESFRFSRTKVDGGWIYRDRYVYDESVAVALCFVPDIDLRRYESHLRDAYTQGYKAGFDDAKNGLHEV